MKQTLINMSLAAAATMAGIGTANAVPAYPGKIQTEQPDGTVITVNLKGDEHFHWAETTDGYTLLRNSEGFWTFAKQAADGKVAASALRYRGDTREAQANGIRPGLKLTERQADGIRKAKNSDLQVDESFPSVGNQRLLMVLVNFGDTQPTFSQSDFDNMMNGEGYAGIGSFRDYYLEASYGKLDISTTVTRWVTLPYDKSYYGSEGAVNIIRDALTELDSEINLADFDNDKDGVLDGLAVIHQGAGQEYSGSAADIWSHSSTIYGMAFDGIQVRRYTIEPERLGTNGPISTIGVVCHEFGHNLGAPDFYDTDYENSGGEYCGTGRWDLLGSGAWNGNYGDRPAGINMWQKIQLGWCEPTVLSESADVSGMKSADKEPAAYRMDTTVPGEYFIMENRQQSGSFDYALPGHGLIIYHVDESLIRNTVVENTLNASFPQAIYTVCSSSGTEPNSSTSSFGNINSDAAPFPGTRGMTEFSDLTLPSAKSRSGRYSYQALSNITEANGEISFSYTKEEAPAAPVKLSATAERGVVKLTWKLPDGVDPTDVAYFTVYRNSQSIGSTSALAFVDDGISDQTALEYYVDATYASGLTSPYAQVSIRIPKNHITEVKGTENPESGTVQLSWNLNTMLSRMDTESGYEMGEYTVASVDYTHRFTSEDLAIYQGYRIRKIGFFPCQGPKDLAITIRVWEADADGGNPRVVSERAVKEFGNSIWNDILLTSPVEIGPQGQLWIGLHCESASGSIQILNDRSGDGNGLGNWIKIADGQWEEDATAAGSYYLRFTLLEPTASDGTGIEDFGVMGNPDTDLDYPIGFSVYRDDELIGYTTGRSLTDKEPKPGEHTYGVACLYKGKNESNVATVTLDTSKAGISETKSSPVAISAGKGWIALEGYSGQITVCDASGRLFFSGDYQSGRTITLPSGFYIVKMEKSAAKVAVK